MDERTARVQFDGGGQAPGPISYAYTIERPGFELVEDSHFEPEGTHNVAEYKALVAGLTAALDLGINTVNVYGDSTLVVQQVHGRWKCNNLALAGLLAIAHEHLDRFEHWTLAWLPRHENRAADSLCRARLKAGE